MDTCLCSVPHFPANTIFGFEKAEWAVEIVVVEVVVVVVVEIAEGSSPCSSSCLEDSLKPFHHDLRSRLLGGEACEVVGVGGCM